MKKWGGSWERLGAASHRDPSLAPGEGEKDRRLGGGILHSHLVQENFCKAPERSPSKMGHQRSPKSPRSGACLSNLVGCHRLGAELARVDLMDFKVQQLRPSINCTS